MVKIFEHLRSGEMGTPPSPSIECYRNYYKETQQKHDYVKSFVKVLNSINVLYK